jgi:hypothetical protein
MSNNFRLISKVTGKAEILQEIDNSIWRMFNEEPDPKNWCLGWYTVIGTLIAVRGINLHSPQMDEALLDWYTSDIYTEFLDARDEANWVYDKMCEVLEFLRKRYTSDSWVTIGR